MTQFCWSLNEKRQHLLESLDNVAGLGKDRSDRLEKALEIFLVEHRKKVSQATLEKFGAVDPAPKMTDKLMARDFQAYSEEDCVRIAEAGQDLVSQFRFWARKKAGIAKMVKV